MNLINLDAETAASAVCNLNGVIAGRRKLQLALAESDQTQEGKTTVLGMLKEDFEARREEEVIGKRDYCEEEMLVAEEARRRKRDCERFERECYDDEWQYEQDQEKAEKDHCEEMQRLEESRQRESERDRRKRERCGDKRRNEYFPERRESELEARRIEHENFIEYRRSSGVAFALSSLTPGVKLPPGKSVLDSITETLVSMDEAALIEVLAQMKVCLFIRLCCF